MTGSRVGTAVKVEVQGNHALASSCGTPAINIGGVSVPRQGCGRFPPELMDPDKYFAARDQPPPRATVTIGASHEVDAMKPKAASERQQ
jgi:hypothetical protein